MAAMAAPFRMWALALPITWLRLLVSLLALTFSLPGTQAVLMTRNGAHLDPNLNLMIRNGAHLNPNLNLMMRNNVAASGLWRKIMGSHRGTDVYYMPELLDTLKQMAQKTHENSVERFQSENKRLGAAAMAAGSSVFSRQVLNIAAKMNVEETMEQQVATLEMLQFYYTVKSMLGSVSEAPHCRFLACGDHATCKNLPGGHVKCVCNTCYSGDGFMCKRVQCSPGTVTSALPVRGPMPSGYPIVPRQAPGNAKEMQMSVFGKDQFAIVLRDADENNRGSLILGRINGVEALFGFRQLLSTEAAFGPVVTALPNGRLAIGFRDNENSGVSYLLGGFVNGIDVQAMLTAPQRIAKDQAQRMVLVPMASSRVVCLYAELRMDSHGDMTHAWGSAALLEIVEGGHVRALGTFRFSEGQPVAALSAVALSPTSLVVGYRGMPSPGNSKPEEVSHELSALWIGMEDNELVIDPHAIAIESEHGAMKARDVALVAQNTFVYSYESVQHKVLKMAVIKVDPVTHRMTIASGPQVFSAGSTEYLHSVSLPLYPDIPSALTIFQPPKDNCKFEICHVSREGNLAQCKQKTWADQELRVVSGGRMSDGRIMFSMVDMQGQLLYQLLTHEDVAAVP